MKRYPADPNIDYCGCVMLLQKLTAAGFTQAEIKQMAAYLRKKLGASIVYEPNFCPSNAIME